MPLIRSRASAPFALALLIGSTLGHVAPARADSFTPAQRAEIVQIMRDALKSDPTILEDAVAAIHSDQTRAQENRALSALKRDRVALQSAPSYAVRGNPSGDVTVVEFLDPRCPYCRGVEPQLTRLLARDHGVRLVQKLVPILGPNSTLETRAIVAAAAQGGYERLRQALMSDTAAPSAEHVLDVARGIGLNPARLKTDMESAATMHQIDTNLAQAREIDLDGTPTFLFGTDSVVPGLASDDELRAHVDAARKAGG